MNRLDRLTAILIQLQSKRVVKAQEIADRFGVSLRTIYRDIRSLEEAGVPIGAEAGIGYFLEDYHLPPVMFTTEEASAMLFGAKLVAKMADDSVRQGYESALYKIKAVLKRHDKEHLDDLDSRVAVLRRGGDTVFADNVMNQIQQAIVKQQVLTIQYTSAMRGEPTVRELEPIGIVHYSDHWHLIAFCRLRQDYRDFRIDRIHHLINTERFFPKQNLLTLQAYLSRLRTQENLEEVVVVVERIVASFMEREKYRYGFISQESSEEGVTMRFTTNSYEGMGRWLLSYGRFVRIQSPSKMQETMRLLTLELQEHYL
jgi:predicted DNA-binding transcriptional regulator YafY